MEQQNNDKFEVMATKIDPAMAIVWNTICDALGTDTYHMLQHFIHTMIRMASDAHSTTPEVQKLMKLLDVDVAWQNAINMCAPNGKRSIAQMILIIEEEGKEGFAMTMIDKPFCGVCLQNDNANQIVERAIEVGLSGLYKDLRVMKAALKTNNVSDVLLKMLDEQQKLNVTEEERQEIAGQPLYNDYGRKLEYGKKTKGYKHRTPDSIAPDRNRILFNDFDRETGDDIEQADHADAVEAAIGGKPFGVEP